ncbi:Uncharacterized protein PB2B2.06c [Hypsizygus marmoreus]|uniref:Uncharacterized protein PB2B2.06c n=1 Tax=Hypsizygus marmoreus TaxID=39966 RepID=A0A369K0N0_HYPMA|nr:Uncharacterized protein PB2B2.06c [Hypsizygus marmoreus]
MRLATSFINLLALLSAVSAISLNRGGGGTDRHDHTPRAAASQTITPPSSPLEWGDINIIHTTDAHGWLLGHQKAAFPEPNYSGDFGDFASFVAHMHEIAIKRDVDLLLVDSGAPGCGEDANNATRFVSQLPYDLLTIGEEELYNYANAFDVHQNVAPVFKGRYLSSNVDITIADKAGSPVSVPVGNRFAKFKTRKGRKITSLGVLHDFSGSDTNITVQNVKDMVKAPWFAEAIKEEPDVFLLAGNMPVTKDNWPVVFDAIRNVHTLTPIVILGGHAGIRDCLQLDARSMSLESGRNMETIGWLTAKLDDGKSNKNITFSRRYLDTNRVTYEYHTGLANSTFDTPKGISISSGLKDLAQKFDLSSVLGRAPNDFTINQAPYPSKTSLLTLFIEEAVPTVLATNNTRASIPHIIIANSNLLRFDIYAGPFTRNDQLAALPSPDSFVYIPNVPFGIADPVLPALNIAGMGIQGRREGTVDRVERRAPGNLTLGYVTHDLCPGVGDDTPHAPLPFYPIPDFIASSPPNVSADTLIDLVFVASIEPQVLAILNEAQKDKVYTTTDVATYSPILANQVLGIYAEAAWNGPRLAVDFCLHIACR